MPLHIQSIPAEGIQLALQNGRDDSFARPALGIVGGSGLDARVYMYCRLGSSRSYRLYKRRCLNGSSRPWQSSLLRRQDSPGSLPKPSPLARFLRRFGGQYRTNPYIAGKYAAGFQVTLRSNSGFLVLASRACPRLRGRRNPGDHWHTRLIPVRRSAGRTRVAGNSHPSSTRHG